MLFRTLSAAVYGINADLVDIEVNLTPVRSENDKEPPVTIVGLPDAAVRESRERIRAAIQNCGHFFPFQRTTINLAPADVRKEGASFDLPIALGILGANRGLAERENLIHVLCVGELSLDGRVRAIKGALPIAMLARESSIRHLILPEENATEAAVVSGVNVYPVADLRSAVGLVEQLRSPTPPKPMQVDVEEILRRTGHYTVDFKEVRGQMSAKRALEIAIAGAHNILLIGPPGSGKTMLAKRLPTIMPPLEFDAALELTKIHSVAGMTGRAGLVTERPFRSPHHTISDAGLIGGGTLPRPGEVSLAHQGVLFLDELPEFDRSVLEVLRQPLEDQQVTISRASMSLTFPASFVLAAAMNPCPCGHWNDPTRECRCSLPQIQRYVGRISGPLLDRIDLHIDVPAVKFRDLRGETAPETDSSAVIRQRVIEARERQHRRFAGEKIFSNAAMTPRMIRAHCHIDSHSEKTLENAMRRLGLSARAYDRILKVSRTAGPSRIYRLPWQRMHQMLATEPHLQQIFLEKVAFDFRQAQARIMVLGQQNIYQRLASFLLEFLYHPEYFDEKTSRLKLPVNRFDIADYLGTAPESAARAFARLEAEGLVKRVTSRTVDILDLDGLLEMQRGRRRGHNRTASVDA